MIFLALSYFAILFTLWRNRRWCRLPAFTLWILVLLIGLVKHDPTSAHWRQTIWFVTRMIDAPLIPIVALEAYWKVMEGHRYIVKLSIHLMGLGAAFVLFLLSTFAHSLSGWITNLNEVLRYAYIGSWVFLVLSTVFRSCCLNSWNWSRQQCHICVLLLVYSLHAMMGMALVSNNGPREEDFMWWDQGMMNVKGLIWSIWCALIWIR